MKRIVYTLVCFILFTQNAFSQVMPVTREPYGGNKRAWVAEQIGVVKVEISYNRPGVKGREGKIWNTPLAHYGFVDLGHGTSTASPWRAGANENTTISFSHPVTVEGKIIAAGTYGFFISLGEEESTLIFSKVNNSWGSFYYDAGEEALRVTVKNIKLAESVEWLKYEFLNQTENSATVALMWEKRMIPFTIEADTKKLQLEAFKKDFRTTRNYYDFLVGIYWCVENNYELEQALAWADRAISFRVMGEKNFRTLQAKASVLDKMGRHEEARAVMEEAIPLGTMVEVHGYGRQLLNQQLPHEALKIFKANHDKYPNENYTHVGMGRAYAALGDTKKALRYMKSGLALATDDASRANIEAMVKKLEQGIKIN